jgi:hypothetical protein
MVMKTNNHLAGITARRLSQIEILGRGLIMAEA